MSEREQIVAFMRKHGYRRHFSAVPDQRYDSPPDVEKLASAIEEGLHLVDGWQPRDWEAEDQLRDERREALREQIAALQVELGKL